MEELAKVIMYHHTDFEQLQKIEYEYKGLKVFLINTNMSLLLIYSMILHPFLLF